MKTRILALVALAAALAAPLPAAAPEYPGMGPDIYDVHADAGADIGAALARASRAHKRVLLDFGANWCIWCRRLHGTFGRNPGVSAELRRDYEVVMVDVNTRRGGKRNAAVNLRYGNPVRHGIPVLVVLGADGRQLVTKDSGELEEGSGHSPAKIMAFLSAWAPPGR
ncbi:MAG TPA: thioredoxin family protein [Opitutaceae bacterium]|jgi:thiol:disulfide interchange protein